MNDPYLMSAQWFLARRITLARHRSNVTYLPRFATQWRSELVRMSDTGMIHGPRMRSGALDSTCHGIPWANV